MGSNGTGRLAIAAAGVGMALALTGCGAGQITQTATQVAAVNGAQGNAGPIAIRNAQLSFPTNPDRYYRAGEDAPLLLTIANSGVDDDELRSVRSPAASTVEITGSQKIPGSFALLAEPPVQTQESGSPESSGSAESSSAPSSGSADPSESTGSSGSLEPSRSAMPPSATVPPGGDVAGEVSIVLTGLKQDVRPGQLVTVTFTFARAGEVTIRLPIGDPPAPEQE